MYTLSQIFLQESKTPPGLNNEGIVVSPGNEVFIPVRVSSTYTTAAAMGLPPSARKCVVSSLLLLLLLIIIIIRLFPSSSAANGLLC